MSHLFSMMSCYSKTCLSNTRVRRQDFSSITTILSCIYWWYNPITKCSSAIRCFETILLNASIHFRSHNLHFFFLSVAEICSWSQWNIQMSLLFSFENERLPFPFQAFKLKHFYFSGDTNATSCKEEKTENLDLSFFLSFFRLWIKLWIG
jgi:hypothetical protein